MGPLVNKSGYILPGNTAGHMSFVYRLAFPHTKAGFKLFQLRASSASFRGNNIGKSIP